MLDEGDLALSMMLSAGVAFAVALLVGRPVVSFLRHLQVIDYPGERSSHALPTPRGGGLTLAAGSLTAALLVPAFGGSFRTGLLVGAIGFGAIGLTEDVRGVPPVPRIALQFAVASGSLLWLLDGLSGSIGWRVIFGLGCLLWLVSYVNAFNFMDGINGLSAAQTLVAGGVWWAIGSAEGLSVLAGGGALAAAAALGFVPFNFPKATMFLGDVGSYFVGAWLAALAVVGLRAGLPLEAVLAPLALYLADTATTIVRRVRAGEALLTAHRTHAYQRLTQLGWSHTVTTLAVAAVMATCSALGALSLTDSLALRVVADLALAAVLVAYVASPRLVAARRPSSPAEPAVPPRRDHVPVASPSHRSPVRGAAAPAGRVGG